MNLEGLFEPIMMFFKLTNSPVIFQTIINKILWDLINTREVVSFINNMIVGIEKAEEHDEVVDEVVKRLAENNLYVKDERSRILRSSDWTRRDKNRKCKDKGSIGLVISNEVKNVQKFLELANYYRQVVKYFASIARLLYNLVKKDQK